MKILKSIGKFILRDSYRKLIFRELIIRRKQNLHLNYLDSTEADNLIIFLIDGADLHTGKENITGGIMSIASIYEETSKLINLHRSKVLICTHPDVQHLLFEFQQFESTAKIFRLKQVLKHFKKTEKVLLHIPEYLYPYFVKVYHKEEVNKLLLNRKLHINIMNQNIRLMPKPDIVINTKYLFNKVTMTTAHEQYSTHELASKYQIPLHKLSVYGGPERYKFNAYSNKENLLIVSPDDHPLKQSIIQSIHGSCPELEIIEIKNIPYTKYRELILRAKWAVTFGEGLDYYFLETIFSGGISFAIFNELFFTQEFKELKTVYDSAELLAADIINDIKRLDDSLNFTNYNQEQFALCKNLYNHDEYLNNIKLFYAEKYTYPITEIKNVR